MFTLYDHLMQTRTKEELAKEVVKLAKERVVLLDRADKAEYELFWIKAKENQDEHY